MLVILMTVSSANPERVISTIPLRTRTPLAAFAIGSVNNQGEELSTNAFNQKAKEGRTLGLIAMGVGAAMCILAAALLAGFSLPLIPVMTIFAFGLAAALYGLVVTCIAAKGASDTESEAVEVRDRREGALEAEQISRDEARVHNEELTRQRAEARAKAREEEALNSSRLAARASQSDSIALEDIFASSNEVENEEDNEGVEDTKL